MEALIPYVTQLIAGAIGGNATSTALKQEAMNFVVRTIVGAIGGAGGSLLLNMIGGVPGLTNLVAGGLDSVINNGIGGLVGGGVLSAIVGAVLKKQPS